MGSASGDSALKSVEGSEDQVAAKKRGGGYRPISLLPTLGKLLDRLVNARITNWYERKGCLNERQFGFRRSRDTVQAIERLMEKMRVYKERNWHVLVVTLDLNNAFNMAWPPYVDRRMEEDGVPALLREVAWQFMNDNVVKSGDVSEKVRRGCPQGSSLGPSLWLVCIKEWLSMFDEEDQRGAVYGQAFADDHVVLVAGVSVKEIEKRWERVWEMSVRWERKGRMLYNKAKTRALFVENFGRIRPPVVRLGLRAASG